MSSRTVSITLAVAVAMTLVIGLVEGGRWPHFLLGALLAGVLWLIVVFGTWEGGSGHPSPFSYAIAAALALVIGGVVVAIAGHGPWWAVGVAMAGVVVPAVQRAAADEHE